MELWESQLDQLRARLRTVLWLFGLSWLFVAGTAGLLAISLFDWLFHLDSPTWRLAAGLALLAVVGVVGWRRLLRPLQTSFSDVDLALKIERRFPELKDRLSSSVAFYRSGFSPSFGSPELQRTLQRQTVADLHRLDCEEVVDLTEMKRGAVWAIGLCCLSALLIALRPADASLAMQRLLLPFSAAAWPRQTDLQLLDEEFAPISIKADEPWHMAVGETVQLFVENRRGELPADVRLQYRRDEKPIVSQTLRRTTLHDPDHRAREVAAIDLTAEGELLRFRVTGGDDETMPWYTVRIFPPPALTQFQISLTPPAYSQRPATKLPPGVAHLSGLLGSRIDIQAKANRPLRKAILRVKELEPIEATLADDGLSFRVQFELTTPGISSYWFDLTDRQSFQNRHAPRYEIEGIADTVPEVAVTRPQYDQQVTPRANIPVRVSAKDDLGLTKLRLHYSLKDQPDQPHRELPLALDDNLPTQQAAEFHWNLEELGLSAGNQLVFFAEAVDAYNLGDAHIGQSALRTFTVVTPSDKQAELVNLQAELFESLEHVSQTQQQLQEQTGDLLIQIETAGRLAEHDFDLLKRLELDQRQLNSRLTHPTNGLETQTGQLLEQYRQNRLPEGKATAQLQTMQGELAALRTQTLPGVEQQLARALKAVPTDRSFDQSQRMSLPEPSRQRIREALRETSAGQTAVLTSLRFLLAELSQWKNLRTLALDLQEIIREQQQISEQTGQLVTQTFNRALDKLSPQEQADLARLANRQQNLSGRLEQFGSEAEQFAETLQRTQQSLRDRIDDTIVRLKDQALPGRMREAADLLAKNRVGQSFDRQQDIAKQLHNLDQLLSNQSRLDQETILQQLRESEQKLADLENRQRKLAERTNQQSQKPSADPDRKMRNQTADEQQQLQIETGRSSRQLQRLQAADAARATQRATEQMQHSRQLLRSGQDAQSADHQQQAVDDLQQARRELAKTRQEFERQLAIESLIQISQRLADIVKRQQQVVEQTVALEETKQREQGRLTRVQLKELRDVTALQQTLQRETADLAVQIQGTAAFFWVLEKAADQMSRAVARLQARNTDQFTQHLEREAGLRLISLIEVLANSAEDQKGSNTDANDKQQQKTPQTDRRQQSNHQAALLSQLKMLRTMQAELIRRTTQVDQLRKEHPQWTPELSAELQTLSREQQDLAKLTEQLLAPLLPPE